MMTRSDLKHSALLMMSGVVLLTGCVTMTGQFTLTAVDVEGKAINAVAHVQGRHIYTVRNGICAAHPKAVVTIRSLQTGKELESESPYQCP
jgi:cbb3-type cytochrome oxidase cytochrome c subunit